MNDFDMIEGIDLLPPGCCSNPEPNEDIKDLPQAPLESLWYLLADAAARLHVNAGIADALHARIGDKPLVTMEMRLRDAHVSAAIDRQDDAGLCAALPRWVDLRLYLPGRFADIQAGGLTDPLREPIPQATPGQLASELARDATEDVLFVHCAVRILGGGHAPLCGAGPDLARALPPDYPGTAFLDAVCNPQTAGLEPRLCYAQMLGMIAQGTRVGARDLFLPTVRFVEKTGRLPSFQREAAIPIDRWIATEWDQMIATQRFALLTPALTIPPIERALAQPAGLARAAAIALAVEASIGSVLSLTFVTILPGSREVCDLMRPEAKCVRTSHFALVVLPQAATAETLTCAEFGLLISSKLAITFVFVARSGNGCEVGYTDQAVHRLLLAIVERSRRFCKTGAIAAHGPVVLTLMTAELDGCLLHAEQLLEVRRRNQRAVIVEEEHYFLTGRPVLAVEEAFPTVCGFHAVAHPGPIRPQLQVLVDHRSGQFDRIKDNAGIAQMRVLVSLHPELAVTLDVGSTNRGVGQRVHSSGQIDRIQRAQRRELCVLAHGAERHLVVQKQQIRAHRGDARLERKLVRLLDDGEYRVKILLCALDVGGAVFRMGVILGLDPVRSRSGVGPVEIVQHADDAMPGAEIQFHRCGVQGVGCGKVDDHCQMRPT